MISFEKPLVLLAILLLAPTCGITLFRLTKIRKQYGARPELIRSIQCASLRTLTWAAAWICACTALAGPMWGTKQVTILQHGNAVVFAIDISRSMTVNDISPSRLDFAKQYVEFILNRLHTTPCGLITLKGSGILSIPLTLDHQSLHTAIQTLSPALTTTTGTNLEQGLRTALAAFPKNRPTGKIIILCTDGEETAGSIMRVIPEMQRENIKLIIAGFGTPEGAELTILDEHRNSVLKHTALSEKNLQEAAQQNGNGSFYVNAADTGSIWAVIQAVTAQDAQAEKIQYIQKPVRRVFECTLAALILFSSGFFTGGIAWKKHRP
ncbi:MAG: vWA domain-containing protein [Treponema sp.]